MCQLETRSQPKLYVCLGFYFWFNFSEGRKTPVQIEYSTNRVRKNHKTNHPKRITFNLKEGRPKEISESRNFPIFLLS